MEKDKKCVDAYNEILLSESMPWDEEDLNEVDNKEEKEEIMKKEKPKWTAIDGSTLVKDIRNRIKKFDPRFDRVTFWFLEDGDHHSLITHHKHTSINKEDIRKISASPYFLELDASGGIIKLKFFDNEGSLLEREEENEQI